MTRAVGDVEDGEIVLYWDEYEPEYELTGNSATYNLLIGFMNSFNLLFALLMLNGSLARLFQPDYGTSFAAAAYGIASGQLVMVSLGWLPLIFSTLFFAIPLVRLLRIQALRRRRHVQNIRKRLFKAIFARQGQPQTLSEVLTTVNANPREETVSPQVAETILRALSLDMDGDMTVTEAAEVQYAFPRIAREFQEVEQLRRYRRLDRALGKIIIESDNV